MNQWGITVLISGLSCSNVWLNEASHVLSLQMNESSQGCDIWLTRTSFNGDHSFFLNFVFTLDVLRSLVKILHVFYYFSYSFMPVVFSLWGHFIMTFLLDIGLCECHNFYIASAGHWKPSITPPLYRLCTEIGIIYLFLYISKREVYMQLGFESLPCLC